MLVHCVCTLCRVSATCRYFRQASGPVESFRRSYSSGICWKGFRSSWWPVRPCTEPTAIEVGVVRSISGTERGNSTSLDPETHCQQMFLNAISRINSNNLSFGKDEKATRFYCLGLRYNMYTSLY